MSKFMEILHVTMEVPVAVGVIGWAGLALLAWLVVMWAADEVANWKRRRAILRHWCAKDIDKH